MKNQKILNQGFTLIELLISVAIIAILATVVILSTTAAKNKGEDSGVKTNLHTVINQAELFFINNGNTYLPTPGSAFGIAACPAYVGATGTNMLSQDKIIANAIAQATLNGNLNACYNSDSRWAVAVGLKSVSTDSWCVDSTGASKQVAAVPASAINSSTFICN